jgi:RNA polymerase sigma-70 factor, ECF subfamily
MEKGKFKDKVIYYRLGKKDKDAFVGAYDLYLNDIYRFIYFKISNKEEAEDIASQTFLKSWNHVQNNEISDYNTLKSLFYKVARNLVIDHYRKKSDKNNISLERGDGEVMDLVDHSQDAHEKIEISTEFENLEDMMKELKDDYREVIILRYVNELSISEIADVLDKKKGTVRVLVHRAIQALKKISK